VLRLLWRLESVRRLAPRAPSISWYRPRRSNVRLLNLIAAGDANPLSLEARSLEARSLWSRLATHGAETQHTSGDHRTIFSESNLPALAAQLREWLQTP
jgi:hypothetical protein